MTEWILARAVTLALGLLALALVAAFVRLVSGPSLADRIVALDLVAATIVLAAVTYAVSSGQAVFVDIALAIALTTFLGTVALARALESGGEE